MAWRAALLAISLWALASTTATASPHGIPDRSSIPPPSAIDLSGPRVEAGRSDDASRPCATQHDRHQFDRFASSARSKREFQDGFVGDVDRGRGAEVTIEEAQTSLYGRSFGDSRPQRLSEHVALEARKVEMGGGTVVNGGGPSNASGVATVEQRAFRREMDSQAWRRLNATGEAVAQAEESDDDDDEIVGEFGSAGLVAFVVCFGLLFFVLAAAKCFCCIECRRRQRIRRRRQELRSNDQGQIPIALSRPAPPVKKDKDILVEIVIDGLPIITQLEKDETNGDIPSVTGYAVADPSGAIDHAVEQARSVLPRGSSLRIINCAPAEPPEPDASGSNVES